MLMARISAHATGVRVAPHGRAHSWLTRAAEATLGWAAPRARPAPTTIPMDVTFERMYLGFIPATALSMIVTMLGVLTLFAIAWVPLRRARPPRAYRFGVTAR